MMTPGLAPRIHLRRAFTMHSRRGLVSAIVVRDQGAEIVLLAENIQNRVTILAGSSLPFRRFSHPSMDMSNRQIYGHQPADWQRAPADLQVRDQLLSFLGPVMILRIGAFGRIELCAYCPFHMPVAKLNFHPRPHCRDGGYFGWVLVNRNASRIEPKIFSRSRNC